MYDHIKAFYAARYVSMSAGPARVRLIEAMNVYWDGED